MRGVLSGLPCQKLCVLLSLAPITTRGSWHTVSQAPMDCSLPVLDLGSDRTAINWSQPFVMHNVSEVWRASQTWRDQRAFLQKHGALQQHARSGIGSRQFATVSRPTSVYEYVSTMYTDNGTGLLFGDATGSLRPVGGDWELPQIVKDAGLVYPMVSIGPNDEGLAFHNHGATWECVVVGKKQFLFFEPLSAESDIDDAELDRKLAAQYLTPTAVWISRHSANMRTGQMPLLRHHSQPVALHTCLLEEGMAVYIPCNWWHATRNVGDAVAVGATGHVELARCADDQFAQSEEAATGVAQEQANGNLEHAEALLRKACRLAPYNIVCIASLAHLLKEMNRLGEAEELLAAAAANLTEAYEVGWLPAQPLSAGLLKLAEQMLTLGRQAAERAGAVVAKAARADPHNAKARVNHMFLRIGQSKSLPEMRALIAEASALAEELSASIHATRSLHTGDVIMKAKGVDGMVLPLGSRFYQVADQGVLLSDCSGDHDLTSAQDLSDQVRSGIAVVSERLARLEARDQPDAPKGAFWEGVALVLGMLSVMLALP